MNNLIEFYINTYPANDKKNYFFDDIVTKWDDYKLETAHDYIQWLFPDETGGVNPKAPKLTPGDIKIFKSNENIRLRVLKATERMLLFYGYKINPSFTGIIKVKKLNRKSKGITLGLFSTHNYRRITRIMRFLNKINMEFISTLFFLAICDSLRSNKRLLNKVKENESLQIWINSVNLDISKFELKCSELKGLDYTGNSCYMDSILLSLLAIPNKIITENILDKNLNDLKDKKILWFRCKEAKNITDDIKRRKNIQTALVKITESIRGLHTVKKCTSLRRLIGQCKGSEAFQSSKTQDAGEFLSYLFNLFQVDVATRTRKTFGTNDLGSDAKWVLVRTSEDKKASPIIDVVPRTLLNLGKGIHNINQFLTQRSDVIFEERYKWTPYKKHPELSYIRKREIIEIDSPIIVFNIFRLYKKGKFIKRILHPPKTISLKSRKLNLTAIVVHTGGAHYTACIKCQGKWFWYDDNPCHTKHIIKYIGSYADMIHTKPLPRTHGTLYFYM